jgi:hypothetical protein
MAILTATAGAAKADTASAACEVYPAGEDHTDVLIPCTFSQRQGYVRIERSDGVTHSLSPSGDAPGNYTDDEGRSAYRQSGLGDRGLIFRMAEETVYVYWDASMLEPDDASNPTSPFSTQDYDATALLRCKASPEADAGACPAGALRMENGQASIVVQDQQGGQFTINFMTDYVNATNREVDARLDGDTWILNFASGEVWEVPVAFIEGG